MFYLISSALQVMLQPECTLSYRGETEHIGYFPGIPGPGWSRAKYKVAEQGASLVLSGSVFYAASPHARPVLEKLPQTQSQDQRKRDIIRLNHSGRCENNTVEVCELICGM